MNDDSQQTEKAPALADVPQHVQRVAFLGTPQIAVPTLRALLDSEFELAFVVSGADKRRGRGRTLSPTPVKQAAIDAGMDPATQIGTELSELLDVHAREPIDLAVVVAFGRIIPVSVLVEIPMVNIHFSDLPRWRGAAPIERAILAGDTSTAVTVMTVAEGLDEGDIWTRQVVPIRESDTVASLWSDLSALGAELLLSTMRDGFVNAEPQRGEVTYAHKIGTDDLKIDWSSTADVIARQVRLGGAWTEFRGQRFKIHKLRPVDGLAESANPGEISGLRVMTGDGLIELSIVQPAGKPKLEAQAWANGAQADGEHFGEPLDD